MYNIHMNASLAVFVDIVWQDPFVCLGEDYKQEKASKEKHIYIAFIINKFI